MQLVGLKMPSKNLAAAQMMRTPRLGQLWSSDHLTMLLKMIGEWCLSSFLFWVSPELMFLVFPDPTRALKELVEINMYCKKIADSVMSNVEIIQPSFVD